MVQQLIIDHAQFDDFDFEKTHKATESSMVSQRSSIDQESEEEKGAQHISENSKGNTDNVGKSYENAPIVSEGKS